MTAALGNPVLALALCVRITRRDGTLVRFTTSQEPITLAFSDSTTEVYPAAVGVTITSIPFELNGATVRVDLNIVSTDGGTIDANDIRNGLYDEAEVSIFLADRREDAPPVIDPAHGNDDAHRARLCHDRNGWAP